MNKIRFLFLASFFIGFAFSPALAQGQTTTCNQDDVNLMITAVAKSAQDAQAETDPKSAVDILATVNSQIAALQADCNDLSFSGETGTVLGPIDFPEGIYKAIATSSGHYTATLSVLDGECGQGSGNFLSTNLFVGVEKASQTVFSSSGCSVLIETQDDNWALQFQKIK